MLGLLFWLGVIGLFLDWRYIWKSGVRPSAQEKTYLGIVVVLCVLVIAGLGLLGGNARALGALTNVVLVTIVPLWSLRRFLIRRASPLPPNYGQVDITSR